MSDVWAYVILYRPRKRFYQFLGKYEYKVECVKLPVGLTGKEGWKLTRGIYWNEKEAKAMKNFYWARTNDPLLVLFYGIFHKEVREYQKRSLR